MCLTKANISLSIYYNNGIKLEAGFPKHGDVKEIFVPRHRYSYPGKCQNRQYAADKLHLNPPVIDESDEGY
jgi:hypothetical protein